VRFVDLRTNAFGTSMKRSFSIIKHLTQCHVHPLKRAFSPLKKPMASPVFEHSNMETSLSLAALRCLEVRDSFSSVGGDDMTPRTVSCQDWSPATQRATGRYFTQCARRVHHRSFTVFNGTRYTTDGHVPAPIQLTT